MAAGSAVPTPDYEPTPRGVAPASEAMAPSEEPLYVVPEEGDVDPADVIRATFAQTSGSLPGAMPERRPEAQAMLFGAEEVAATLPGAALPDADDWAEGEGYEEGYEAHGYKRRGAPPPRGRAAAAQWWL